MHLRFSGDVENYLLKLKSKDPKTFVRVKKQIVLFETNPQHPSLRIHRLSGKLTGVWSILIGLKLRLLYFIKNGEAWGYLIGTHDEVYKK